MSRTLELNIDVQVRHSEGRSESHYDCNPTILCSRKRDWQQGYCITELQVLSMIFSALSAGRQSAADTPVTRPALQDKWR